MSANESMLGVMAESIISVELEDDSTMNLNNNVDFSKIDISEIDTNENPQRTLGSNLSITLDQSEVELLKRQTAQTTADSVTFEESENNRSSMQLTLTSETMHGNNESENTLSVMEEPNSMELDATNLTEYYNGTHASSFEESDLPEDIGDGDFLQYPFIELSRRLWKSTPVMQHYTKGCLWSPDGTCILLPIHLDGMHVIELPSDLYTLDSLTPTRPVDELKSAVHVKEGGTVYDCSWYPFMNSGAPETCCWLASRQHEPIHMWDAFNGELRCTYRGYDDVDEVESAISVSFSNDGQKVIGGYKKSIKIFDTNVPGRDCCSLPVKQAVSCFALTTDNDETVTAGSWNGYINHYDLRAPKLGALFTLGGHSGGITWLKYAATGGTTSNWMLFSGARKDNKILQWDMRNYTQPVAEFRRSVATNQRIYFDLMPQQQRYLVSGDTGGLLRVWDLSGDKEAEVTLPLHNDCCNGVNFHPTRPILASSSGQYHFTDVAHDEQGNSNTLEIEVEEKIVDYENSLLLLWFGRSTAQAVEAC